MQDLCFGVCIDGAQRIVEQNYSRTPRKCAGERRSLFLSSGEVDTALAQHRFILSGKSLAGARKLRRSGCPFDASGIIRAVRHIRSNRVTEEEAFLWNESDLAADLLNRDRLDRHAVDENLAFLRIVNPGNQVDQRGLAAARRSDDAECRARSDGEAHAAEDPSRIMTGGRWIVKPDVAEFDCTSGPGRRQMSGRIRRWVLESGPGVENLEQSP